MNKVSFAADQAVFKKGDKADKMYKILSGSVKVVSLYGDSRETELATLKQGAYFGEMGIIDKTPRSATVIAAAKTELLEIDAASFTEFVRDNISDAIDIMKNLSSKVRATTDDYIKAGKTVNELLGKENEKKSGGVWEKLKAFGISAKEMYQEIVSDSEINEKNSFAAGEVIFKKGDRADRLYKVKSGEVAFFVGYGTAKEKEIAVVGKNAIFGEMGVIENERRSTTAVAKTDATLIPVINTTFESYIAAHPEDAIRIMQNISGNLRRTTADYLDALKTISELVKEEKHTEGGVWQKLVDYSNLYDSYAATGAGNSDYMFSGIYYNLF